jgi:collagenase-like PrtC family protease
MMWTANDIAHPRWPQARFHVAGLFEIEFFLLEIARDLAARFAFVMPIDTVYGSLACKWNGGRIINPQVNKDWVSKLAAWKELEDVRVAYAFNSATVDSSLHGDPLCNKMLDILAESYGERGSVILASDSLSDYIRNKYPELRQRVSIIKSATERPSRRTIGYYRELCKRFDMVVLHPDDTFREEILCEAARNPEKYEIIINEKCVKDCTNRKEHYRAQSISFGKSMYLVPNMVDTAVHPHFCKGVARRLMNGAFDRSCTLTDGEIKGLYDMGFRNYKLEGRGLVPVIKNSIKRYMFNPDFIAMYPVVWQAVELKYGLGL